MNKIAHQVGERIRRKASTDDIADASEVEVKWSDNDELVIEITCAGCGHVNQVHARKVPRSGEIECPCGELTVSIAGLEDLRDIQRSLDALGDTLENLFK